MKVAVLGLGKVGHNMAALLAARGFEVTGFTRDPEKADRKSTRLNSSHT